MLADVVPGGTSERPFPLCSHGGGGSLSGVSYRNTNHSQVPSSHLQIPSPWGVGFKHMNLGGDIQTLIRKSVSVLFLSRVPGSVLLVCCLFVLLCVVFCWGYWVWVTYVAETAEGAHRNTPRPLLSSSVPPRHRILQNQPRPSLLLL